MIRDDSSDSPALRPSWKTVVITPKYLSTAELFSSRHSASCSCSDEWILRLLPSIATKLPMGPRETVALSTRTATAPKPTGTRTMLSSKVTWLSTARRLAIFWYRSLRITSTHSIHNLLCRGLRTVLVTVAPRQRQPVSSIPSTSRTCRQRPFPPALSLPIQPHGKKLKSNACDDNSGSVTREPVD